MARLIFWLLLLIASHALISNATIRCGKRNPINISTYRLVGGTESEPHSWPWMALHTTYSSAKIGGRTLSKFRWQYLADHWQLFCSVRSLDWYIGGMLLSYKGRDQSEELTVRVGAHQMPRGGNAFHIKNTSIHPGFTGMKPSGSDIALLQLTQKLDFSDPRIAPVCLPSVFVKGDTGQRCVVLGWGPSREKGPYSGHLQEISVPVWTNEKCNSRHFHFRKVDLTMLCAGPEDGSKDSCKGDSGGPLLCNVGGLWEVHGISSWGIGCGVRSKPGVYARVSIFVSWLQSQIASMQVDAVLFAAAQK